MKLSAGRISIAALAAANIVIWPGALKPYDGKMKMTILDVGHGDSIFIEFPSGGNMLVDGGSGGGEDWDAGRNAVLPFLRSKGVQVLDAVVLTHPDSDHVGGLVSVIEGIDTRLVFDNGAGAGSMVYARFRKAVSKKGIKRLTLRRGDSIAGIRRVDIACLNPPSEWVKDPSVAVNDKSLVLKIRYGERTALLCGDIGARPISEIMLSPALIASDLILLPHHGDKTGIGTQDFIAEVKPAYAVISQGKAEKETARSADTARTLSSGGVRVFRTNCGGAVFAVTDGKGLFVDNFESSCKISR